jgi:hypothetical protein
MSSSAGGAGAALPSQAHPNETLEAFFVRRATSASGIDAVVDAGVTDASASGRGGLRASTGGLARSLAGTPGADALARDCSLLLFGCGDSATPRQTTVQMLSRILAQHMEVLVRTSAKSAEFGCASGYPWQLPSHLRKYRFAHLPYYRHYCRAPRRPIWH